MKASQLLLPTLLTLISLQVNAGSLSVGDNLTIESVNGKLVNAQQIQLDEGIHMVALRFSDFYVINAEDSSWVRSDPLFTRVKVKAGEQLELNTSPLFSEEDARAFLQAPQVNVQSNKRPDGQQVLMSQVQLITQLFQEK
ncbi:DUF2057 domain-containing protein [Shewanella submarina]|uniref:DUF2057 family protein n=1 Tax=Shewanella submarina TaxID=2016376 RepID=A0ABV7GBW9_9GAMM|nr:DUF2057 family protein [Shewanella submarina]MCL1038884.1 DUF2057 domain-containing protein [Shewanella submarina]